MTEILAELNRKIHDISLHMGGDDFEQNVACMYALEDAIENARLSAEVIGIAL